ncbi:hypothetical protein AB5I41_17610 [Sphingomonas sp. MMS24-JH45]
MNDRDTRARAERILIGLLIAAIVAATIVFVVATGGGLTPAGPS